MADMRERVLDFLRKNIYCNAAMRFDARGGRREALLRQRRPPGGQIPVPFRRIPDRSLSSLILFFVA
jgi:hypothetical protein